MDSLRNLLRSTMGIDSTSRIPWSSHDPWWSAMGIDGHSSAQSIVVGQHDVYRVAASPVYCHTCNALSTKNQSKAIYCSSLLCDSTAIYCNTCNTLSTKNQSKTIYCSLLRDSTAIYCHTRNTLCTKNQSKTIYCSLLCDGNAIYSRL